MILANSHIDIEPINNLYTLMKKIIEKCNDELETRAIVENFFTKIMIVAIWSYIENDIVKFFNEIILQSQCKGKIIESLLRSLVERKVYQLFDAKAKNINRFLNCLGVNREKIESRLDNYVNGEREFIYFFSMRNAIVHENLITFPINDSFQEVFEKFKVAIDFWSQLKKVIIDTYIEEECEA